MKKISLILIALFAIFISNAQMHKATPVPAKRLTVYNKKFATQGLTAACDTLKLDSARNMWSANYYTAATDGSENDGYVLGVSNNIDENGNGFTVLEDANYYDVSAFDYKYITGGSVDFAIANSNVPANLNKDLVFKVYNDAGGVPGNPIGSVNVKLSDIKATVDKSSLYEFKFSTPVQIPDNKIFYISIDHSNFSWDGSTRDSIAIVGDSNNQAPAAAYQYVDLNPGFNWYTTNFIWNDNAGNPLNVNLYLFPYVSNSPDGCATLPVSLFNFKGSIKNNQAYLTWNTAAEFNNKGFEIERSGNGRSFTDLGFVNGAGTSSKQNSYTYTDATLSDLSNTFYYRIKQVDVDGKTSYSKTIALSLKSIAGWKMYPNPLKDKLNIELNLTASTKITVQLISKDGKLLMNADKGLLLQGNQQMSFNIQNLAGGSYFVRIKAGDKAYTQMIIKQ